MEVRVRHTETPPSPHPQTQGLSGTGIDTNGHRDGVDLILEPIDTSRNEFKNSALECLGRDKVNALLRNPSNFA